MQRGTAGHDAARCRAWEGAAVPSVDVGKYVPTHRKRKSGVTTLCTHVTVFPSLRTWQWPVPPRHAPRGTVCHEFVTDTSRTNARRTNYYRSLYSTDTVQSTARGTAQKLLSTFSTCSANPVWSLSLQRNPLRRLYRTTPDPNIPTASGRLR